MPPLSRHEIREKMKKLATWKRGDEIAPHKPLLLLLAIARLIQGEDRILTFESVETTLREMLEKYGPARKSYHPELPFWHLQSDKIWQVSSAQPLAARKGSASPTRATLLKGHAEGGLKPEVFIELKSDPSFRDEIVRDVLETYFPESMHQDILNDLGLSLGAAAPRRDRAIRISPRKCLEATSTGVPSVTMTAVSEIPRSAWRPLTSNGTKRAGRTRFEMDWRCAAYTTRRLIAGLSL